MFVNIRHVAAVPITALGLILSVSHGHSATTYVYASNLSKLCTSEDLINKSWCEGFISSELEIISNGPVEGVTACVPPLTTLQEGVKIAEAWLSNHPEASTRSASSVIANAFADAFPCQK
jgi:hypothetical protein